MIRRAEAKDASTVASLGAATFAETFKADNAPDDVRAYLAEHFGPEVQRREIADPRVTVLIAECDGAAAGYAKMERSETPPCVGSPAAVEIARIYVASAWHGRGIGAALMQACLERARDLGAQRVWLGVWERNERALAFYRRFGFRECGDHEFVLGSDRQRDLIMVRGVDPAGG